MVCCRYSQIYKFATDMRKFLELGDQRKVDLKKVVTKLKGKLSFDDTLEEGTDGIIKKTKNGFEIILRKEENEDKFRYELGDKIGHLLMHMEYLVNDKVWEAHTQYIDSPYRRFGWSNENNDCRDFVTAFLMPEELFRSVVNEFTNGNVAKVHEVAAVFGLPAKFIRYHSQRVYGGGANHV